MNDFKINLDLWVHDEQLSVLLGKFNASVLTDNTIRAIKDDIEKHLDKEKDNE